MSDETYTYALRLANTLRDKHFPDASWTPASDTLGLLLQIDNMTSTLVTSQAHICDRIERRLDRLYSKLVTEPAQRQEAAIAAHKAEMDKADRLNSLFKGADPALLKEIHAAGGIDSSLAELILEQPDPAAVMRYLYLGPGRRKLKAMAKLGEETTRREVEAISRRVDTIKGVVIRAVNGIHPQLKNKTSGQGTEDK